MRPIAKVDESKLLRKMAELERVTGKSVETQLNRSARLLCVELARQTQPFGNDKNARESGENAILGDLGKIFFTVEKRTNRTRNFMDLSAAMDFHKQNKRRGGRTAKLPPNKRGTVTQSTFKKLLKTLQKRVGLGKAGWATAALAVGADVGDALRGIPAWVKKHAGIARGASRKKGRGVNFRVVMTNAMQYASGLLTQAQIRDAVNLQRGKFLLSLQAALRAEYKKRSA